MVLSASSATGSAGPPSHAASIGKASSAGSKADDGKRIGRVLFMMFLLDLLAFEHGRASAKAASMMRRPAMATVDERPEQPLPGSCRFFRGMSDRPGLVISGDGHELSAVSANFLTWKMWKFHGAAGEQGGEVITGLSCPPAANRTTSRSDNPPPASRVLRTS
jgi:hypothetical protein